MGGRSLLRSVPLILAAAALSSCAPSSLILMTARNEDRIFTAKSDRPHVEKYLGSPLAVNVLVPPVRLRDFDFSSLRSSPSSEFRTFPGVYSPGQEQEAPDLRLVALHCRYSSIGHIVRHGEIGDMNATAMMTFGLTEIATIPIAIREVAPDSAVKNLFDVWYSQEGRVLAFYWTWSKTTAAPP